MHWCGSSHGARVLRLYRQSPFLNEELQAWILPRTGAATVRAGHVRLLVCRWRLRQLLGTQAFTFKSNYDAL